jgi:DNA-binding response OmpR family regulator
MLRDGTGPDDEPGAIEGGVDAPPPVVIVVEDDVGTLGLLADVAEDAGWEARTCRSLRQMDRTLGDVEASLIILDDDLPDGRGADEVRRLRAAPGRVPVVVCTGASASRLAEIGNAVPVVTKPFTVSEIERVLDGAWPRRRRMTTEAAG